EVTLGVWDAQGYALGGLGIDVLHTYDPAHQMLFFGWGDLRSADNVALVVEQPAKGQDLGTPDGVTVAADGSAIVTDDQEDGAGGARILKITREGDVSVLAGAGAEGAVYVAFDSPQGVVVRSDGTLIVADFGADAVLAIRPDGGVQTLVSSRSSDAPVVKAAVNDLDGLALGPREELYIVNADQVLKLEGGEVTVFAGGGTGGDGVPATEAEHLVPSGVAVAPHGTLFVSARKAHRVREISPDGIIRAVPGTGAPGLAGDGSRACGAERRRRRAGRHAVRVRAQGAPRAQDSSRRDPPDRRGHRRAGLLRRRAPRHGRRAQRAARRRARPRWLAVHRRPAEPPHPARHARRHDPDRRRRRRARARRRTARSAGAHRLARRHRRRQRRRAAHRHPKRGLPGRARPAGAVRARHPDSFGGRPHALPLRSPRQTPGDPRRHDRRDRARAFVHRARSA